MDFWYFRDFSTAAYIFLNSTVENFSTFVKSEKKNFQESHTYKACTL